MDNNFILSNISDYVVESDEIWILSLELDSLVGYNYRNKYLKKIIEFPEKENCVQRPLFGSIYNFEKKIWLFPIYANDIYVYDIEQNVMNKLGIPFEQIKGLYKNKHLRIVSDEEKIYCVSKFPSFVVTIDKRNLDYQVDYSEEIEENSAEWQYNVCFAPCLYNKQIYIPTYKDSILIYNTETRKFHRKQYKIILHTLTDEAIIDWIVGIQEIAGRLLAYSYDGYIYEIEKESFRLFEGVPAEFLMRKRNRGRIPAYRNIVGDYNGIYLFPQYSNYILYYDYSKYSIVFKDEWNEKDKIEYGKEIEWMNGIAVMNNWYNGYFYKFDTVNKQFRKERIKLPRSKIRDLNLIFQGTYIIDELGLLMVQKETEQKINDKKQNIGTRIWERIN